MRITNNMIVNSYLTSFNKSLERQNKLQEQLSDGKAIHRPSDDPVKVVRSLKYNTNLAENDQFAQNVKDAASWMETTDSALSEMNSIMTRARELVISADGTKSVESLHVLGEELDGLIDAAVTIGNTQIGDRYLFAGQMDKTRPMERSTITDPLTNQQVEVVLYHGDNNKISMPAQTGLVNPIEDSVNLTGIETFGPAKTIGTNTTLQTLNDLLAIKNELLKTSAVSQSNAAGGAATVGGTYSGSGYQEITLRITAGAAGAVTAAEFSADGGSTWTAAVSDAGSPPAFTLGATGVTTSIATAVANATGDTYAFHVPHSSAAPDINWLGSAGLGNVTAGHDVIVRAQTGLGARSSSYAMLENMLSNNNSTIMKNLSANEDLDVAKAIIDFKNSENVYNAALAVGSKIMPQSLVDFLS
ncbi:MAG: flagellar hook-associated protein FlgL [Negativicutes bacterium]